MEYTVQKLGQLAGVSTRTLRYYDELGLLKPARINSSGYRIYGQAEVNALQHILFYRELGLGLEEIRAIVSSPAFDAAAALKAHRNKLLERRAQLDALIANVDKTLAHTEGRMEMSDQEKFEGFKQKLIDDNERQYGAEAREKYGNEAVDRSNRNLKHMSAEDYERIQKLEQHMFEALERGMQAGDPAGEDGQQAAELHKQWLTFYWDSYSKEAHAGVAQLYVDDERFTAYYDKHKPGMAAFLRDAVHVYTQSK